MAPASSAQGSASALRDGAAVGSSVPFIASIILFALIVAAVGRGRFILARRLQSRLDILPNPHSSAPFHRCPDSVCTNTVPPNPVQPGFVATWSRKLPTDHFFGPIFKGAAATVGSAVDCRGHPVAPATHVCLTVGG